jgi:hypothetical protein
MVTLDTPGFHNKKPGAWPGGFLSLPSPSSERL